jgi:hypothetical protein
MEVVPMVSPKARPRGIRDKKKSDFTTPQSLTSQTNNGSNESSIFGAFQPITPTRPTHFEEDRRPIPNIFFFATAILEGQLPGQMNTYRGIPAGEAPEKIALTLVNSSVDNSAL